jgi:hypothetical protein
MSWKKIEEVHYWSATVDWIFPNPAAIQVMTVCPLIYPPRSNQRFWYIQYPPEYRPKEGDRLKLELRLELKPGNKRRSWSLNIVEWPPQGMEREEIHEIIDWDS